MIPNFKKNKSRNPLGNLPLHIGGILILLISVLLVVANIKMYQKRQEFITQVASLQNQIKDIQERNDNLKQGILKTNDNQYIEKVAREELDLQKQGEKTVSFIMPPNQQQKVDDSQKNNWQAWLSNAWNWIKGKF